MLEEGLEKALAAKEESSLELVRERYLATEESTEYAEAKMASIKEAYEAGDITEEAVLDAEKSLKESLKAAESDVSATFEMATKEEAGSTLILESFVDAAASKSLSTFTRTTDSKTIEPTMVEESVTKTR